MLKRILTFFQTIYDQVLEAEHLRVADFGVNQKLTCAAHTHGYNPPELSSSFLLKLDGSKFDQFVIILSYFLIKMTF